MGVPRLFPWIQDKFSRYVRRYSEHKVSLKNVDWLYIDGNAELHPAAQQIFYYGENKPLKDPYENLSYEERMFKTFEVFFNRIEMYIKMVNPKKGVYIAIDGSAPQAKQSQQRERRFRSKPSKNFNSASITPGTMFMHRLSQFMIFRIQKYMNETKRDIKFYFDPPTVSGEGEHKILDFVREMSNANRMTHCLVGPDADLIMLTLAMHLDKVWLLREDQHHYGNYYTLHMSGIAKDLKIKNRTVRDGVNDFIVMGFFVGNDFLPKIPMFHLLEDGLEKMLSAYDSIKHNLTKNGKLDFVGFKEFVEELVKSEEEYLLAQAIIEYKEDKFENTTLTKCVVDDSLKFDCYRKAYYKKAFGSDDYTERDIEKMCNDYIKSFVWILEYYIFGLPSWDWLYKHHYAPLMSDLVKYISDRNIKFDKGTPSLPFVQLLTVLPPFSSDLLPAQYSVLMTNKNSPLVKKGYYPENFDIDFEGKIKDYQGVVLLPFVDKKDVVGAYDKMTKCCVNKKYIRNTLSYISLFEYVEKLELGTTYTAPPPIDRKITNLRVLHTYQTKVSRYSTSFPAEAMMTAQIARENSKGNVIVDATANVGGDTLAFARVFSKVIAIEKSRDEFDVLKMNVEMNGFANVKLIHDSFLKFKVKDVDVLYFDPPWGGTDYKKSKRVDLYLDGKHIMKIISKLLDLHKNITILLKAPHNFNKNSMKNMKYQENDYYRYSNARRPIYKLFVFGRKVRTGTIKRNVFA